MRQEYRCICDECKIEISKANDENEVSFNSLKLVYCPKCYNDLISKWENWRQSN
jgi:hypothetical protein